MAAEEDLAEAASLPVADTGAAAEAEAGVTRLTRSKEKKFLALWRKGIVCAGLMGVASVISAADSRGRGTGRREPWRRWALAANTVDMMRVDVFCLLG